MPEKEIATVLIVDDDPIILNIVKEQISFYGYQPIVASSAQEALKIAQKQKKIDLLLTDIIMPVMNGIDLARYFAALHPETQIIFMSGHGPPPVSDHEVFTTEYGFVQKPFATKTLISKIESILNSTDVPPTDQPDS